MYPFSFKRMVISFFKFEAGISTTRCFAWIAFLTLVRKSAIGSVTLLIFSSSLYDYQLAFIIPGIKPAEAISLKLILLIPNWRIYPFGLPVSLHLLCIRTLEEFLGNFCKPTQSPSFFSRARFSAYFSTNFARFTSRAFIDSLAID